MFKSAIVNEVENRYEGRSDLKHPINTNIRGYLTYTYYIVVFLSLLYIVST